MSAENTPDRQAIPGVSAGISPGIIDQLLSKHLRPVAAGVAVIEGDLGSVKDDIAGLASDMSRLRAQTGAMSVMLRELKAELRAANETLAAMREMAQEQAKADLSK